MHRREMLQRGLLLGTAGLLSGTGFINELYGDSSPMAQEESKMAGDLMELVIGHVTFSFRWCPAGTFMRGSPLSEAGRLEDERQHQVTLTRGFWMQETPLTQEMWAAVMGGRSGSFRGDNHPVERLSWNTCDRYIQRINALEIAPAGYRFSLPTEAQWEYACRAGTTTPFYFGNVLTGDTANFNGAVPSSLNSNGINVGKTTEVRSYPPNAWGLYDMHGNVWEWCLDWYNLYPRSPVIDPVVLVYRMRRVLRGGSWYVSARNCRSAARYFEYPIHQFADTGMRLALVRMG